MANLNIRLVSIIINYFKKQLNSGILDDDGVEALSIGIQCLETAYNIVDDNISESTHDLEDILNKHLKCQEDENCDANEQRTVAQILKNEGNNHMNNSNYKEAISCYTRAIELDPKNAVYYCNRAAALNSFGDYDTAIEDCKVALKYNPLYHKAHARMGAAHMGKNQFKEARDSFQKALLLQPDSESYKSQLDMAKEALNNYQRSHLMNFDIDRMIFPVGNEGTDPASFINMFNSILRVRNPL